MASRITGTAIVYSTVYCGQWRGWCFHWMTSSCFSDRLIWVEWHRSFRRTFQMLSTKGSRKCWMSFLVWCRPGGWHMPSYSGTHFIEILFLNVWIVAHHTNSTNWAWERMISFIQTFSNVFFSMNNEYCCIQVWFKFHINSLLRLHLTHLDRATHTRNLCNNWFRKWLGACSAPCHYLNHCWFIVKCTLGIYPDKHIIFQENAFEYVICEMAPTC